MIVFTIDWALEFLDLVVTTFSNIWDWLASPISDTVSDSSVIGPLINLVIPDAIGNLSPLILMFGVGLGIYLGLQIAAWILSWIPLA